MDPRQRLALELTWELLEDAFVVPETLRGQQVAVYLGAMTDDYAVLTLDDTAENLDHHSFSGVSRAMIANRISYAFGLRGSSLTVDSGQSSSLVAVHLAGESLRTGESALAIAGGVHLNLAGETGIAGESIRCGVDVRAHLRVRRTRRRLRAERRRRPRATETLTRRPRRRKPRPCHHSRQRGRQRRARRRRTDRAFGFRTGRRHPACPVPSGPGCRPGPVHRGPWHRHRNR